MNPAEDRIAEALDLIELHTCDGSHHKQWLLDQVVRTLVGDEQEYRDWVERYCQGEDGPDTYEWDTGIPP